MKERKRTIRVNGKAVSIRFLDDPEITETVNTGKGDMYCNYCRLSGICHNLKDPQHPDNNMLSFTDYCKRRSNLTLIPCYEDIKPILEDLKKSKEKGQ